MAGDSLARVYLRALTPKRALRAVPDAWTVPSVSRALVPVDAEHLSRYRRLCGFPDGPMLPPTYPHLTAFPMGMALLTRREFPYPVLGLVHIRNEIEQSRPIAQTETLDYYVWIDKPYRHEKGTAFEVRAEVSDSVGNLVWRSSSTYLRRAAVAASTASPTTGVPASTASPTSSVAWRLPADLGRRYGALSGDRNPIHLYPWTARLFGFRRQIAHGMWSAARCLATLLDAPATAPAPAPATETGAESGFTFTVDFRAPVLLPSDVALASTADAEGATEFWLTSAGGERTHLAGRLAFVP